MDHGAVGKHNGGNRDRITNDRKQTTTNEKVNKQKNRISIDVEQKTLKQNGGKRN